MAYSRYIPEIKDKDGNIYGVMDKEARASLDRKYEKPSAGIPAEDIASGVIPDVPAWAKAAQKPSYTAAEVGATTTQEVNNLIAGAIGDIHSFDLEIVQELPATNIKTHTIYLLPKTGEINDVYDEYVYINNSWEMIGNTQIDLSGYALKSELPSVPVQDVQIDGTSVLQNGVANIPKANENNFGVVKANPGFGLSIMTNGSLYLYNATDDEIKYGSNGYKSIKPEYQHKSVFYGLAKAAGDTTQSQSSNAIGTYTDEAKAAIQTMLDVPSTSDIPDVPVQDVQVDGASIINQNGVANIPVVTGDGSVALGLVKPSNGNGTAVTSKGSLAVVKAEDSHIKIAAEEYRPIVPKKQHISAFYGLAKAAGDTTQSASSNAVGTYTAEAKAAIQAMLGIDPASIASQVEIPLVETVSGAAVTITGQPNTRYMCGEVTSISITPPAAGSIDVVFTSGSTVAVLTLPSTVKMPEWFDDSTLDTNTVYEILITDGVYGSVMTWAT